MKLPRIRRIVLWILPPPREAVTFRQAIPLVVFLVGFAALCFGLDRSGRVLFVRPWMLSLVVVSVWIWWMSIAGYSGLPRRRATVAMFVRLLLVAVFAMALAEPRAVRTSDTLAVVYAVDVSDSIGEKSSESALEFLAETVTKKPEKDRAGLIVFGRNAAVELPPRQAFPFQNEAVSINSRIDRDATNIEQALSLAAAMLPEEDAGRIVLISDGTSTEGSLSQVLDELKSRGVAVDVLPIQYDYTREVWLERLELPRYVKIGESYEAVIVLSSLQKGSGRLVLREQDRVIFEQTVQFEPGKNRYVVPIKLREPGFYEYAATIETSNDADQLKQNNTVLNYIYVKGEGRVLLVTDPKGDPRDWQTLARALREEKRIVDVQGAYDFPRSALSMMPYDSIVFVNVAADLFDAVQFQSLHDAVRDLGIGFLMVGGKNSFGPGGYHKTKVEDILPVSMDVTKKKILPKSALAIILHTCEFAEGNTWAKRVTKEAIRVLGAQDEVGVLAYLPGGPGWVFELTPASEYETMVKKINAAEPGDMPAFEPSMEDGLEGLLKSNASAKHMIIISDGDPQAPTPALLKQFQDNQVSVSTVSIFPHGGMEVQALQGIANVTGGRYYHTNDPEQLPSIFIREAKTLKRSMVQTKTFTPEVGFPSPILKGINALPPLHGYVLTTPKEQLSEVILRAKVDDDDQLDPVLARWKAGLGTAAAFTSDLSPNWGADWVGWEGYRAFVKQLMTDISRVQEEGHLRMWCYTSGSQGVISVEDFHPDNMFLDIQARISGPHDRNETVPLRQIAPRRYQATVPLAGRGRYQVMAMGKAGDRTDRAQGGFIVPYSPEYLRFRSNPIVLKEIAEKTGGTVLAKDAAADEIYRTHRKPKQSSRPIFDWFLAALVCLVPLDVAVRRIQIDRYSLGLLFGRGRRKLAPTETMGALLKRKKSVAQDFESQRLRIPLPARPLAGTAATRSKPVQKPPAGEAPSESAMGAAQPATTTSHLLAMKRKRQEEEKP